MREYRTSEVWGFHGCSAEVGRRILAGEPLEPSRRDYDWLGAGAYFWEADPVRAWEWADWKVGRGDFEEPFVVGARIKLGKRLDLTNRKNHAILAQAYNSLERYLNERGIPLPQNQKVHAEDRDYVLSYLDCAVINHNHDYMVEINETPFDTVRGVFTEGNPVDPGARFRDKTHIQIAVRNPSLIHDCREIPRPTSM